MPPLCMPALRVSAGREQLGMVSGESDVHLAADLALGYDHRDGDFEGHISGVGNLEKGGRGTWKLSNASAHVGDDVINEGKLRLVGRVRVVHDFVEDDGAVGRGGTRHGRCSQ